MLLGLGALLGLVDHANWPTEAFGFSAGPCNPGATPLAPSGFRARA